MRTSLFIGLVLLGNLPTASAFQPVADQARVVVQTGGGSGRPVKITTPDVLTLEPIVLAERNPDASGNAIFDVPLSHPLFVDVDVDNQRSNLLLSPGDDLKISLAKEGVSPRFQFLGQGSEAAAYLQQKDILWKKYEFGGGKHIFQLEPKEVASRLDSAQKAYAAFDQTFIQKTSLAKPLVHLLTQKGQMQLLMYELNYALAQYNPYEPSEDGRATLKRINGQVPFDEQALAANLYEYGMVLTFYMQTGVLFPIAGKMTKDELMAIQPRFPLLADQQIVHSDYPASVRSYLRAKNVLDFLRQQGITPTIDSLMTNLKNDSGYQHYESDIKPVYDKWATLRTGQPAPDISGLTPTGDTLSSSSLKGKVVYVDVWATWCMPCRQEFPDGKKLQQQFADNDQVAFLYVSTDRDKEAWQKFLTGDADFKGIHINQPPGELTDSFRKAYQMSGIPRYILIDQAGNLVSANAARPSSGQIAGEIERLLK